jgi:hypothetical protein
MNLDQLISEGRAIQRECIFLEPEGSGERAAVWYEFDRRECEATGFQRWLTVDTRFIPAMRGLQHRYLTVLADWQASDRGVVVLSQRWPDREGISLYARSVEVLPPFDAVISRGSASVANWIATLKWDRNTRYHSGFAERELAEEYEEVWLSEFPFYLKEPPFAVLGGWHWPGPDDDWHALIDEQLLVCTVRDSEPWVEAWRLSDGEFNVIERCT